MHTWAIARLIGKIGLHIFLGRLILSFCFINLQEYWANKMKIAVIGQSMFGAETYNVLRKNGHKVVGVFTIPDVGGKQDPLGNVKFCSLT